MRFPMFSALNLKISSATDCCRKTAGRSVAKGAGLFIAKAAGLFIALLPLMLAPLSAAEMCAAQSAPTDTTPGVQAGEEIPVAKPLLPDAATTTIPAALAFAIGVTKGLRPILPHGAALLLISPKLILIATILRAA